MAMSMAVSMAVPMDVSMGVSMDVFMDVSMDVFMIMSVAEFMAVFVSMAVDVFVYMFVCVFVSWIVELVSFDAFLDHMISLHRKFRSDGMQLQKSSFRVVIVIVHLEVCTRRQENIFNH